MNLRGWDIPVPPTLDSMPAYLDYAATAPLRPAARAAWLAHAEGPANPASLHSSGRAASAVLEDAREEVAHLAGVRPKHVVFTSGGTEADVMAIRGLYEMSDSARVLVSGAEHKAVLETVRSLPGVEVVVLPLSRDGAVRLDALQAEVVAGAALVAAMAANNEVGTVNDLAAIGRICAEAAVPWHCDAVQWPATRALTGIAADSIAISGHKIGGPVGVGALLLPGGVDLPVYTHGGGQEAGIRSGTVDVAGAAALAAAMTEADRRREQESEAIGELRDRLQRGILRRVPDAVVNADGGDRLVSHLHVTFPGCPADLLLMLLDAAEVEVSTGSACTAGIPQPSHVLLAMGAGRAAASSSLRFSLGWASTGADVDAVLSGIGPAVARARAAGGTP